MSDELQAAEAEARKRLYWKIQGARSHMQMVRETAEAFEAYDAFVRATEAARYRGLMEKVAGALSDVGLQSNPRLVGERAVAALELVEAALAENPAPVRKPDEAMVERIAEAIEAQMIYAPEGSSNRYEVLARAALAVITEPV